MYYETNQGDDELQLLFRAAQAQLIDEDDDEDDEEEEVKVSRSPRRRRTEASRLEQENQTHQSSPSPTSSRPKRRAAVERSNESNSGQQKIDEFIAKKRSRIAVKSTRTKRTSTDTDSILPLPSFIGTQRCPMCDRLVLSDALEEHTNACMNQNDDAAKELVTKSKERSAAEAKMKKLLFQRTPRKTANSGNNETTVCGTCGMQMTVFRLANQHKAECLRRISPRQKMKTT